MVIQQRRGQCLVDLAGAAREGFGADTLDHFGRRHDDALLAQRFNKGGGQHDATVGLLGQFGELGNTAMPRRSILSASNEPLSTGKPTA